MTGVATAQRPRYSILVAAFNVAATIERCIDSIVAAKRGHDIELIVLDDGSSDRTAEICAGYTGVYPWIRLVTQLNAGVSEVRNRLIRESAGRYLAFVDGDDAIEDRYFDVIDEHLRETGADMLVFGHNREKVDGTVLPKQNVRADLSRADLARLQLRVAENASLYMLCWARVFKRELAGGFVFDRRIRLGEDTAFNIHLMNRAGRVLVVPDCLYSHFESLSSLSSSSYKPALLNSFEMHYRARLRVHAWPAADSADWAVLRKSIALSYVEYVLLYLLNNVRHLPLLEKWVEVRRIRNSVLYQECVLDYAGRSPHRGVRYFVSHFIGKRYLMILFGMLVASFLARFRVYIFPAMWSRPFPVARARVKPEGGGRSFGDSEADAADPVSVHESRLRRSLQLLKKSPFVRNVAAVATGIAAAQAISFAFMPFLTRLYGPEPFGALAAFSAIVNIIAPLATLGYANAIVMADTEDGAKAVARLSLACTALVAPLALMVIFLFQSQLAVWTGLEATPGFLYLIPVSLLVGALLSVGNQAAIREGLFKAKAGSYVGSALLTNMGKLAGGMLAPSGLMLIAVTLLGTVLNYLMLLWRVPRKGVFQVRSWFGLTGTFGAAREHREFALYRMPHSVINAASLGLPVIVLTTLYGATAAGQYSITTLALGAPVSMLGQSVYEVFYPRITRTLQSEPDRARALIGRTTAGMVLVSALPFGAIVLFGDWVFPLVFGSEWARAGEFSQWVALWMAASLATRPAVAAIPALRKQGLLLVYEIVMTVARIGALYFGQRIGDDLTSIAIFSMVNVVGYVALLFAVFASVPRQKEVADA